MRTSNKILLSVFLACVIIMIAVQVTLRIKYRNGNITKREYAEVEFTRHELKGINYISFVGLGNVAIYPSDTPGVETEKDTAGILRFKVLHDTLVISDTSAHSDLAINIRYYRQVNIYLSGLKNIIAAYSDVELHGSPDSNKAIPYKLNLVGAVELSVNWNGDSASVRNYFKTLEISAGTSDIKLHSNAFVKELNLFLTNSNFDEEGATIGRINLQSDNNSAITLHGNNIRKLILPQKQ